MEIDLKPSVALLLVAVFAVSMLSAVSVNASAVGAYLPPFSIYGTPAPPSNSPIVANSGQYWGPYVGTTYLTWFTSSEAIIEGLVNGYIQYDEAGISNVQEYNQLQSYVKSGEIGLNFTAGNGFGYVGFNTHAFPGNNINFRHAIQELMNYQSLNSVLDNGILGLASPYYFYPGVYSQYFGSAEQAIYQEYGAYNTTAAVQNLKAAGLVDHSSQGYWSYPNGTKFSYDIYYPTGTGSDLIVAMLDVLVSGGASINLTITLTGVSFDTEVGLIAAPSVPAYFIGWSLGSPPNPTVWYFILGPDALNVDFAGNYTDPIAWNLMDQLNTNTSNLQQAVKISQELGARLQNWTPYIIFEWSQNAIPVNIKAWRGNVFENVYGSLYPSNVHPANSSFGSLYRYGLPDPIVTDNPYPTEDLYSAIYYGLQTPTPLGITYSSPTSFSPSSAYNWTVTSGSGMDPNGHPFKGTEITFNFLPNLVWGDGAPFTAVDYNFTLWYYDVGGFVNNPYTGGDMLTVAPGVNLNYTAEASASSFDFFNAAPGFVDSYVPPSNPDQITLYFNTTSYFNLNYVFGIPILPEHTLAHVQPATFSSETPAQYLPQEPFGSPYSFSAWSPTATYAEAQYFPSYALSNPYTNVITAPQGSTATFSMNITVYNTNTVTQSGTSYFEPWVTESGASGNLYVMNGNQQVVQTVPLSSQGNGVYTASISTSGLSQGSYYLVAQANWTGPSYYYYTGSGSTSWTSYSYHEYGVLNVTSPTPTSHTTAPSSSTTAPPSSSSSSSSQATSTKASGITTPEILVVVLVIVAVVLIGVGAARRPKASAT
jgi:hypothetical protein